MHSKHALASSPPAEPAAERVQRIRERLRGGFYDRPDVMAVLATRIRELLARED